MTAAGNLTTILIALFIAGLVAGCGGEADTSTGEQSVLPRPVKLVEVEATSNEFPVNFPALIEAAQSTVITFQVGGLLQELPVVDGQEVASGALIARLDQRDFETRERSARAQFEAAESEYQRAQRLADQDAVSQSVLEQRRSQRDIARANLDSAEKALTDSELSAPFSGVIGRVHVENFQNVSPQQAIVTLQNAGEVEAVVNVPARVVAYTPQIEPINTTIRLDALPELEIPATFKEASPQADPSTQSFEVRFSFTPPEDLFVLPGMTGAVSTTLVYSGEREFLGLAVPAASIVAEGDDRFVWRVDLSDMTVARVKVSVGPDRFGETVRILEGIAQGDIIAGAGAAYLHEGMAVRAWEGAE